MEASTLSSYNGDSMNVSEKQFSELEKDVQFDQTKRASAVLEHIIKEDFSKQSTEESAEISVEEALQSKPVLGSDIKRTESRVLFVTQDSAVLESSSEAGIFYQNLAKVFDEVHVLVLVAHKGTNTHKRVTNNMWTYRVHAKYWWRLPWVGSEVAHEACVFNDSVRPDIIVGTDPFEAGLTAYFIARDLARPVQIHVKEDFYTPQFLELASQNRWRRRIAKYVLRRVKSVRTTTHTLATTLKSNFKSLVDVSVLPQFYNFAGLRAAEPIFDVHEKYQDFGFVMVTFGQLTAGSSLQDVFIALGTTLQNKGVGLIVIGDGPAKELYVKKAAAIGGGDNVIFLPSSTDVVSILKTADVLLEADERNIGERHVLQAIVAGLPVVAVETELRKDLFKDGESAFLYTPDDLHDFGSKVNKLLNSSGIRTKFTTANAAISEMRLQEDADTYYYAYRDSVETVLVPDNEDESAGVSGDETIHEITNLHTNSRQK